MELSQITKDIWADKYRFGEEKSVDETFERVVTGLYEKDPDTAAAARALSFLKRGLIVPGGRIISGAGTGKRTTLLNCYVSPKIQDSMDTVGGKEGLGLMDALKVAALAQQMGGGIGMGYSTIRPKGAIVKRTHSVSSGVIPFMKMWDAMCSTVRSAGSRRGAMIATLAIWHPDVIDFVVAKHKKGVLTNFNVSVLVTDAFMECLSKDLDWDLYFTVPREDNKHVDVYQRNGQTRYVYHRLKARELWNLISKSTYDYAEPGVIFIDRVNDMNNLGFCEEISATNPCLSGETWVTTDKGVRQIKDIQGKPTYLMLDGLWNNAPKGFFPSGFKATKVVDTIEGFQIRLTENHSLKDTNFQWKRVSELEIGDQLLLSRGRIPEDISQNHEAYLMGHFFGDGWVDYLKGGRVGFQSKVDNPEYREIIQKAHKAAYGTSLEWEMQDGMYQAFSPEFFCFLKERGISERRLGELEYETKDFLASLIAGLIDSDGGLVPKEGEISKTQYTPSFIRIYQPHILFLQDLQRVLLRMGVYTRIYGQRSDKAELEMVAGSCCTQEKYCLNISGNELLDMMSFIKLRVKDQDWKYLRYGIKRHWFRKTALATVSCIRDGQEEQVYDVHVPGINAFEANGFVSHNCGEQPLPPNGACDLGHVNLAKMVSNAFTAKAKFNYHLLVDAATELVRLLDNVLEVSLYPTEEMAAEATTKRRIGVGYTGLGNALQMLRIPYGGKDATNFVGEIGRCLRDAVYTASVELAKERGSFPAFDADKFCDRPFIKTLPEELQEAIYQHGIRNGVLLTLAPTGTTSILLGNVSSGMEPTFLFSFDRKVLNPDGETFTTYSVQDYGVAKYGEWATSQKVDPTELPDYFVDTKSLTVRQHLEMMGAAQEFIDASISKTINCPTDISFEEFKEVYQSAYDMGLKGCTTYRKNPQSGRGEILSEQGGGGEEKQVPNKVPMQEVAQGRRYRVKWAGVDAAFYVMITDYVDERGQRRPFEIFIMSKSAVHEEWIKALTLLITAIFRREGDSSFVVEELKQVYSPRGGMWIRGHHVNSIVAMIGYVIEEHLQWLGLLPAEERQVVTKEVLRQIGERGEICEKCNAPTLVFEEGCRKCSSCGFSDCG